MRPNVKSFRKSGTDYSLAEIRKARAAYLGKISLLDELLGRIVDALKKRGTWDNTILCFTADHGLTVGEHNSIAKGHFWEEVSRIPMLMRIPGVTDGGQQTDALAQLIDLYPTLLNAVGGKVSPHVRGRSLLPALRKTSSRTPVRNAAFCEISHDRTLDYMAVTQRFKWFTHRGQEHLYDLQSDPCEQSNLIESGDHQQIATQLRDRLRKFLMTEQLNYSEGYRPLAERIRKTESMKE